MTTIRRHLTDDHRRCDQFFNECQEAIARRDWPQASERYAQFRRALDHHFAMEEQVLFPAFEQATGHSSGPTAVMRYEHTQMRNVAEEVAAAIAAQDADAALGLIDSFLILMEQHNLKEENVLYLLTEQTLGDIQAEVLARMAAIAEDKSTAGERTLDVSELPPPEPLERILDVLPTLSRGEYLHVRHSREPYPLYTLLEDQGYAYVSRPSTDVPVEIFIWRLNDLQAKSAVRRLCDLPS
jgi:uncharacterized protein (DUF2249 family)